MHYRLLFTILGVTLAAGSTFAQAPEAAPAPVPDDMELGAPPPPGDRPGRPEDGLRRADTNKDGKISFDEMKAARPESTQERFDAMDTNKDGLLGPEDRPAGDRGKGRGSREADPEARRQLMQMLMSADTNQDGKTSFDEVSAAKPGFSKTDFDRVDRDKDGFITAADTPRPPKEGDVPRTSETRRSKNAKVAPEQREKMRERMRKADTNADGYVSRDEARTGLPNVTDDRFKAMDRNGDGKLGPEDRPDSANPPAN